MLGIKLRILGMLSLELSAVKPLHSLHVSPLIASLNPFGPSTSQAKVKASKSAILWSQSPGKAGSSPSCPSLVGLESPEPWGSLSRLFPPYICHHACYRLLAAPQLEKCLPFTSAILYREA